VIGNTMLKDIYSCISRETKNVVTCFLYSE
jgi:hypothetical protein